MDELMITAYSIAVPFLLSAVLGWLFIPRVLILSHRKRLFDMPDDRKMHDTPVPRLGGITFLPILLMCVCLVIGCWVMFGIPYVTTSLDLLFIRFVLLFVGMMMLYLVGVVDDLIGVTYQAKFMVQIACALLFPLSDLWIHDLSGLLWINEIPVWIGIPVTVFAVVYVTNAINLIDGLDGLAVGMSCISATTLFIISVIVEDININVSVILVCVIGACTGFWPYNRNPARIFMGDVGSQMLGFLLSTISVMGLFKMHALVTMLIPFLAMAVPLADTAFAFIRRILKGQSPFHADKGHFHHRLLAMGLSQKQAVTVMYAISIMLGIFAYLMIGKTRNVKIVCLVVAFVLVLFIVVFVLKIYPRTHLKHQVNDEQMEEDIKIYHEKGRNKNE